LNGNPAINLEFDPWFSVPVSQRVWLCQKQDNYMTIFLCEYADYSASRYICQQQKSYRWRAASVANAAGIASSFPNTEKKAPCSKGLFLFKKIEGVEPPQPAAGFDPLPGDHAKKLRISRTMLRNKTLSSPPGFIKILLFKYK